ncbi:MAG: hypothetical protein H5T74_04745 [Actinobacteria bacterium]|nr:hypothetical protein [Actinomycetota bacterium]
MSRFFLAVRLVILAALLVLLAAVFWGIANHEKTEAAHQGGEIYEQYQRSKPAGYTSVLLVALVIVGILVVLASILFEYHQVREGRKRQSRSPERGGGEGSRWV